MPEYRICLYSKQGNLVAPAQKIDAADDDDAVRKATVYRDGLDIELWEGAFSRLVIRVPRKPE